MWKHCYLFVCALAACVLAPGLLLSAQDPSSQPLIHFNDLIYTGAFRLPRATINNDDFSQGGKPFTYNPARNSLYVGSRAGRVAEIAIPQLVNRADVNALFFAPYLQGFNDPMEGNLWQVTGNGAVGAGIEGMLVHGGRFYGTAGIYYDANNIQRVSHYARSTTLSTTSFVGMVPVWQPDMMGFVAGYMSAVPPEWQSRLGGPAVTGQCCTTIAWKTSWGPSAFVFDPATIGSTSLVPATPLLYYPNDHATLGEWSATGSAYGATTRMSGVALIAGTRTALFFGSTGAGEPCYGNGTNIQSLHKTTSPDGTLWCYDPTSTDKGSHAYPYRYQIWAYDLNDFAAVRAGSKKAWEVLPYGVWPFDLPVPEMHARLGGVAYDPARQMLYLSQMYGDMDTYANRALIHALRIGNAPATTAPPTTTTGPSGSGTVTSLTLTPNKQSPQPPGTTVTWTATAGGGITPYEYKWWVHDGNTWTSTSWGSSNTFNWTPVTASQYYRVAVWVRSYGAIGDQSEASKEVWYTISGTATPGTTTSPTPTPTPAPTPSSTATAVALTTSLSSPQLPGTTVTWTASPTGGVAPHQYQWYTHNGTSWTQVTGWTTMNTYAWTPTTASQYHRVAVWVRSAGATGTYETTAEKYFVISTTATPVTTTTPTQTTTTPPPTTTTPTFTRVVLVKLTPNVSAPQPPGSTITWTAVPTGGYAPHQYQWWIHNGSSWLQATGWSTSNTYAWQPTTANANYRIAVWVKSAGSTGTYEATTETYFAISGTAVAAPPPPTTTSPASKATSVTITANLPQPQFTGSTITWTASVTGGVAPYQYQWWTYDGSSWISTAWTSSNSFAWKPTVASSNSRVAVYVRSAGNTGNHETSGEAFFAIWKAQ